MLLSCSDANTELAHVRHDVREGDAMFVRWKTRPNRSQPASREAVLVTSYRNAEGKPRQKQIDYLGRIGGYRSDTEDERALFWGRARWVLDQQEMSEAERSRAVAALTSVVPPVDETV